MNIIPEPVASDAQIRALFDGHRIVDIAEQALRAAGATDRASAEQALDGWLHTPELSPRERRAALLRFPTTGGKS